MQERPTQRRFRGLQIGLLFAWLLGVALFYLGLPHLAVGVVGITFISVGTWFFRKDHEWLDAASGKFIGSLQIFLGVLALAACSHQHIQLIFSTTVREIVRPDVEKVRGLVLTPYTAPGRPPESLLREPMQITEQQTVRRIVETLRTARVRDDGSASRKWSCLIEIDYDDHEATGVVHGTLDQTAVIRIYSNGTDGWCFGDFFCDGLVPILEKLAQGEKPHAAKM